MPTRPLPFVGCVLGFAMALVPAGRAQHLPGKVLFTREIDRLGNAALGLADLDGNGVTDLAVGDRFDADGGPDRGAVWIRFRDVDGTVLADQKISDLAGGMNGQLSDDDGFGAGLADLGDMDGNGTPELGVLGDGTIWILFMESDGTVGSFVDFPWPTNALFGTAPGEPASLGSTGDLDGNGTPELVLGIPKFSDWENLDYLFTGAIFILFLDSTGTVTSTREISPDALNGLPFLSDETYMGSASANLGDLDGDTVPDLAVGAASLGCSFCSGGVRTLLMNADGTIKAVEWIAAADAGAAGHTGIFTSGFGWSLAALGDLNGDGTGDLAIGTPFMSVSPTLENHGLVTIAFLDVDGSRKSHHVMTYPQGGVGAGDVYGASLALLGAGACGTAGNLAIGANGTLHIAFYDPGEWVDLGSGLAGVGGIPALAGSGSLIDGETATLSLTNGRPNGTASLVLGFSRIDAPFKQGVFVPFPNVILSGLPLDANGDLSFGFGWPACIPPSVPFYWQYWIQDPAAPAGWSSSNGLESRSP